MPHTFYPKGKDDIILRLGGPQSQSGHRGEEKKLCPCQEVNPDSPVIQPIVY
jgi:hypothetical protein